MSFQWHVDPEQMIIDLKKKIERQTKRIAELEAENAGICARDVGRFEKHIDALTVENQDLVVANEQYGQRIAELEAEQKAWRKFTDQANATMDKAEAKIERLRAALFEIADAEFSSGGRLRVMARMALREDEGYE